jgi:NAD(P)-dependent dehydrogenase (short-subunit alcohol dehydrogenase family)
MNIPPPMRALITGATDGVGRLVAKRLAAVGTGVIVHGRNHDKAAVLLKKFSARPATDRNTVPSAAERVGDFSSFRNNQGRPVIKPGCGASRMSQGSARSRMRLRRNVSTIDGCVESPVERKRLSETALKLSVYTTPSRGAFPRQPSPDRRAGGDGTARGANALDENYVSCAEMNGARPVVRMSAADRTSR